MKTWALLCALALLPLYSLNRYESYLDKGVKNPPKWMVKEIQSAEFKQKGKPKYPGKSVLNRCLYVQIKNGKIKTSTYSKKPQSPFRVRQAVAFLKLLNRNKKLPDLKFVLSLEDGFTQKLDTNLPVLAYAKNINEKKCFLFPDYSGCTGFWPENVKIKKANHRVLWSKKIDKVFWRGSTTGGVFNKDNWRTFPRAILVLMSMKHPNWIDARFTNLCQGAEEVEEMEALKGEFVQPEDSLKYKYLIDVDGNTCTFPRLFWILASNSLLIKHDSPDVQWFYAALEPNVHYLPCKRDLSDLRKVISWARKNDKKCEQMMKNGKKFTETHLQLNHTLLYTYLLLDHISRLQKNQIKT